MSPGIFLCRFRLSPTPAFVAAVPLVLGEAYVVINFLARSFLFDTVGTDLFDAV
jgi:hypothetical protein